MIPAIEFGFGGKIGINQLADSLMPGCRFWTVVNVGDKEWVERWKGGVNGVNDGVLQVVIVGEGIE